MKKLNQRLFLLVALALLPIAAKAQLITSEASDWSEALMIYKQNMDGGPKHYFFLGESVSFRGNFEGERISGTLLAVHFQDCDVMVEGEKVSILYDDIQKVWGDGRWGFRTRRFSSQKFEIHMGKVKTVCD